MDGTSFDALARSLATSGSRRGLVRRGALGALGAALAGLGARESAVAAECRGRGDKCRRNGQCCSGKCRRNKKCAAAGVGKPCNPNKPSDCKSGECGCTARDTTRQLVNCTCRSAGCIDVAEQGCEATADCCDGFCLDSQDVCFPPQQQCIPEGASCADEPTLCCPGLQCINDECTEPL